VKQSTFQGACRGETESGRTVSVRRGTRDADGSAAVLMPEK